MLEGGGGDHRIAPVCRLGHFFVGSSDCLASETPHSSGISLASHCHPWVCAGEVTPGAPLARGLPAAPGSERSQLLQRAGCSPHSGVPLSTPPAQAAQNRRCQL